MSERGLIERATLDGIAAAIREKGGTTGEMLPGEMEALIRGIVTGVEMPEDMADCWVVTAVSRIAFGVVEFPYERDTLPQNIVMFSDLQYVAYDTYTNWVQLAGFRFTSARIDYGQLSTMGGGMSLSRLKANGHDVAIDKWMRLNEGKLTLDISHLNRNSNFEPAKGITLIGWGEYK